jgi:putative MFS transporter
MPALAASRLNLHSWLHRTVIAVALIGFATGVSQYIVTASLADVARAFGANGAADVGTRVGLSGTTVGIGLAIIRFASLGALPLSSAADRVGRRRVMLWCTAAGLALTAMAALSPSFWWFVAIIAIGRPLLTAANAVGSVVASEETTSAHRTKALALAIAGYGIGVGAVSVLRVPLNSILGFGFRGLYASTLLLLAALPFIGRMLGEPDRFVRLRASFRTTAEPDSPVGDGHAAVGVRVAIATDVRPKLRALTAMHPDLRPRLLILIVLTFAFNFVTGPVNTFLFFYAEGELGISRASMAGAVVASGLLGLAGLVIGRWAADRIGRRMGSVLPHLLLAAAGVLIYSGSPVALVGGFWLGALAQSAYGPAYGALTTEVFPTSNRATAQGWLAAAGVMGAVAGLVVFGAISDTAGSFVIAALAVCVPCALTAVGYLPLPETRGQELEESAPELPL